MYTSAFQDSNNIPIKFTYSVYLSTIIFYSIFFILPEVTKNDVVFTMSMKCTSSGGHSAQTVHLPSKLTKKGTPLRCRQAPEMIQIARNVLFQVYAGNKHPNQNNASGGSFSGLAKPLCRNSEICHRRMLRHTDSCLLVEVSTG